VIRKELISPRLIAIMLGRLRMDIVGCQKAYNTFAENVFGKPTRGLRDGTFKETNLEDAIKRTVEEENLGSKMINPHDERCKVSVSNPQ
jgi:hypothetical protein